TIVFKDKRIKPETLRKRKSEWMQRIWTVLETHLGTPPKRFQYRMRNIEDPDRDLKIGAINTEPALLKMFTPQTFATKFAGFNPASYVTITANPLLENNKLYRIRDSELGKPTPGDVRFPIEFINVSPSVLEKIVLRSLNGAVPVWAAVDIAQD